MTETLHRYTFAEAVAGTAAPQDVLDGLALIDVPYTDYNGAEQTGQLVVAAELADEVRAIFADIHAAKFPVARVIPIVMYRWDDHASIRANNCSAFNFRVIEGTERLSHHALGRAIDINPEVNPYIVRGVSIPPGYTYDTEAFGAVKDGGVVVRAFLDRGWEWGGYWKPEEGMVDYQHFQKPRR